MSKIQVVFIAGLYHSGTTLLDLLLGQHPHLVGLGEAMRVCALGPEPKCSCGESSNRCPFWSVVAPKLETVREADLSKGYEIIIDGFGELFGSDQMLVDSSKDLPALQALLRHPRVDVKVIHLVRDVRSWTLSIMDRDRRDQKIQGSNRESNLKSLTGRPKTYLRSLTRNSLSRYIQWYRNNRKIQRYLQQNKISVLQIGYEELVLYTREVAPRICEFLEVENNSEMYSLGNSGSHIVRGNQMRFDETKRQSIVYDNRWLYRDDWLLSSLVLRNVMKYNASAVYSNLRYTENGITRSW